ncbi:MAG: hypothetical protein IJ597_06025, partial [Synergistaceae bacterium]|nr:hypothetical protein [Synergistaceae bacterium]
GSALRTVILASSVLYELIGPACAKLSLALSHSYDKNLKEEKKPLTSQEEDKLIVNLLIERIREIQQELPEHSQPEIFEANNNNNIRFAGGIMSHQHLHSNKMRN